MENRNMWKVISFNQNSECNVMNYNTKTEAINYSSSLRFRKIPYIVISNGNISEINCFSMNRSDMIKAIKNIHV